MQEPYKSIKFHPSKIYLENPKKWNQSFYSFQISFQKTDQNGGAHGKIKQVFKVEKLNQQKKETIKSLNTYSN